MAYAVKEKYESWLLKIPGVIGVSATRDRIIVYVVSEKAKLRVPSRLEGFPVEVRTVGRLRALWRF